MIKEAMTDVEQKMVQSLETFLEELELPQPNQQGNTHFSSL